MLIGIDMETYYDSDCSLSKLSYEDYIQHPEFKVHCVGIKIDDQPSYIVWGNDNLRQTAFGTEDDPIAVHLKELFAHDDVTCYAHNMGFDGTILKWLYDVEPAMWACTQRMAALIHPHDSSSLAAAARRLRVGKKGKELVHFKGVKDIPEKNRFLMEQYCKNDTDLSFGILMRLKEFIPNDEFRLMDITLRMFLDRPFCVDDEEIEDFIVREAGHKAAKLAAAHNLDNKLTREVLASSNRFSDWIVEQGIDFEQIPSPTAKNPDNMKWPLDRNGDEFRELRMGYPDLKPAWDARLSVASNINITRAERILNHSKVCPTNKEGRLGFLLQTYGASNTLRWSGGNKVNGQNLTKGTSLRTALEAPKGQVVAVLDQSNIEARMLAWLAGETQILSAFAEGRDLYSEFASVVYNYKVDKSQPLERFVGKTCILGLGYQMGAARLRATLGIGMGGVSVVLPLTETRRLVNAYRSTYREITRLWHEAAGILQLMISMEPGNTQNWRGLIIRNSSVGLPNGTFLQYPHIHNKVDTSTGEEEIVYKGAKGLIRMFPGKLVENIIQALSRIVIADNILSAVDILGDKGQIALIVHDEIVSVVDEDYVDKYMERLMTAMRQPPAWCSSGGLVLDVEGGYSHNYSK